MEKIEIGIDEWIYGKGELILLVDDEIAVLKITKRTLENFGYRVLTARNGLEAIQVYSDKKSEI